MTEFLADFTAFMGVLFVQIENLFNWFTTTIIGKILIFFILLSIFWYFIKLFIMIKD